MKPIYWLFVLLTVGFLSQTDLSTFPSTRAAFADPPPWAPAYGYRRKHHADDDDDEHEHRHHHEDREDDHRRWEQHDHNVVITRVEEAFHRFDANHDGRISLIEWTDSRSLFNRLDLNHDGILTRDEYSHIDEQNGFVNAVVDKIKDKLSALWAKLW